jgi:hypothetical protein
MSVPEDPAESQVTDAPAASQQPQNDELVQPYVATAPPPQLPPPPPPFGAPPPPLASPPEAEAPREFSEMPLAPVQPQQWYRRRPVLVVAALAVVLAVAVPVIVGLTAGNSGGKANNQLASPAPVVARYVDAIKAGNKPAFCATFVTSQRNLCSSGTGRMPFTLTGGKIGKVVVEGDRAVVAFTGSFCEQGLCLSNSDENIGFDSNGASFSFLFQGGTLGSGKVGLFLVSLEYSSGAWYVVQPRLGSSPNPGIDTAAESNLQTALTGAKAYYTNANQTYTGILTPSTSTSDLQSIDTGLGYVDGTASSGPHEISVAVLDNGSSIVLTAWAPGAHNCWGILDVTASGRTIDGIRGSSSFGTFFFVTHNSSSQNCAANLYAGGKVAVSASSATGFPPG